MLGRHCFYVSLLLGEERTGEKNVPAGVFYALARRDAVSTNIVHISPFKGHYKKVVEIALNHS
jgi:hypothetical protein